MKKIRKEYYVIAILLISFMILTFFVAKGNLDAIDKVFFDGLIKIKNTPLTKSLYVITNIGSTIGVLVILLVVAFIFIRHKSFSDFKYVLINVLSGVVFMKVTKDIIKRIRPTWKWITQGGFSYPSGHTISAVLLYGTLILLVKKKVTGKIRKPLIIFLSIMMFLIPISRIYFGVHYLSDVIASLIIGTVILIISNMLMNKEFNCDKNKIKK